MFPIATLSNYEDLISIIHRLVKPHFYLFVTIWVYHDKVFYLQKKKTNKQDTW